MTKPDDERGGRRKILVIGLGNPDRGDDAVGAIVVDKLAGHSLPSDVTLRTRSGDMLSLMEDWDGYDTVLCVDATSPIGVPGCVRRIDLATGALPPNDTFTSSHAFNLVDAIRLARTLQRAPQDIIVYAIEGCCFDQGAPMTDAVSAAADEVARRVIAEVSAFAGNAAEIVTHA